MDDNKFELNQIVWAKVLGYPWWPGVIHSIDQLSNDSESEMLFKVNFIGENTQYLILSALLPIKYVNDFEEWYPNHSKTKNKVKFIQWLLACIKIGKDMIDGLLDFRDLISVNHSLIQCRHKNKCKRNDCNHNSIDYLLKNINSSLENQLNCGYHSLKFISKDELLKHENNLCEFIRGIAHQETSIRKVCESLHELSRFSVSQESQIENLLKYLVNICVQSSCPKLQEVGKVAQKIKVLWHIRSKSNWSSDNSNIPDKKLRKNVCWKIYKVLERKKFDLKTAQGIAITIEENLRKKDPSMSVQYRYQFRKMIRDIKFLNPIAYQLVRNRISLTDIEE